MREQRSASLSLCRTFFPGPAHLVLVLVVEFDVPVGNIKPLLPTLVVNITTEEVVLGLLRLLHLHLPLLPAALEEDGERVAGPLRHPVSLGLVAAHAGQQAVL